MKGNEIIVTGNPGGVFLEGIVEGTPLPGTLMQIKPATALVGGRPTWQVYNPDADGNQRMIAVLLADTYQGMTADDAYVTGSRCFLYVPRAGEELNVRVSAAGTGTGNAIAIGDILMVNDGDGLLVATTGSPESEPFQAMEAVADVTATGTLVHCIYTGY